MTDVPALLAELRRTPFSTAVALMQTLSIGSQASFSRLISRAGSNVVAIGRARARRYALSKEIDGVGRICPLFRVDFTGKLTEIARLLPLEPRGNYLQAAQDLPRWLRGHDGDGVFEGQPHFLDELRPQGFLGASFARRNPALQLPGDPGNWSADDCVTALARAGDDGIGDLVLGEESARRLYARWAGEPRVVLLRDRAEVYPALAEETIAGVTPGPSAGGRQPKFGTFVGTASAAAHLLVKFSPAADSEAATRWRDLLLSEHHALQTLRRHQVPAVTTEILEAGPRVYLQTGRFDRVGLRGRRAVVTLAAMNAEYLGLSPSRGRWVDAVQRLRDARWLFAATLEQVRHVQAFGEFIANSDMHLGNLSLLPADDGTLALAPVYDMLPMAYAPVGEELPEHDYHAPVPQPGHEALWFEAGGQAIEFWHAVAQDTRVSTPFRELANGNASAIGNTLARLA